jgi:hypothetical protein
MNPIQLLMQGVGAAPIAIPLFNQGRSGSMLDKSLEAFAAQQKSPDLGRQTGDAIRGLFGLPPQVAPGTIVSPKKQKYRTETRIGAMGVPYEARIPLEGTYGQLPADYKKTELKAGAVAEAFRPGAGLPGQQFNPNQDLPASAEQSVDTSPFQHQMAIYEQGRNAATTQAERNQVRDLGLAIHKAHNPQLYSTFQTPMASDRTFNPLMANMARDYPGTDYPLTREDFIKERGIQLPQTMTNVDARNELIEGNRLEGEQMAGQLAASLEAQEFMKKFLQGQAGGK